MLAVDTETCLIAPCQQAPALVCVSTSAGHIVHWTDAEHYLACLLNTDAPVVGHHIAYDMAVIASQFPALLPAIFDAYEADRITDTGIRQKLIDIATGARRFGIDGQRPTYSLAALVKRHLGLDLAKGEDTWRLRYGELRDMPIEQWPEAAQTYVVDDAHATHAVWEAQENSPAAKYLGDQYRQTRAAFWIQLMKCWGLTTDAEAVREFEDITRQDYATVAATLREHGLLRPDKVLKTGARKGEVVEGARDTAAVAARLVSAYTSAGKVVPRTEKGAVKLDAQTCEESGDPILQAYGRFGSIKKQLSTDVPLLWAGAHTPIHPSFDTLLETGRVSASPNVMNLPRVSGMRECFAPRPGFLYASADFGQIELRTLAQVCLHQFGSSRLAELLNAGQDPHTQVAAEILEVSYDEAKARIKAADPVAKNARQCGKVANFGFPGGLGPARLVYFAAATYDITITEPQAKRLKNQWISALPEMRWYLDWVGRICESDFPAITQLYSNRTRGGVTYTEACNSFFQGLAADAAKTAGWLIARACYVDPDSPLFGSRLVNFVHDEFIIETPEAGAAEAAEELARLMVLGASPWIPDVPAVVEAVLMRRWLKGAVPVRDAAGRLVPWEPEREAA